MKSFNRIFIWILIASALIFIISNAAVISFNRSGSERPYRVEVNRIALEIEKNGIDKNAFENIDLSKYKYIKGIHKFSESDAGFYNSESDYIVREIQGELYRFDYLYSSHADKTKLIITLNAAVAAISVFIILIMLFIRNNILRPFEQLTDMPYQLAKGNLTTPLKANKNRFFGKFIWGIDLLRESIEQQKVHELELQKNQKMLLLSLSHDIKTPLSAIKLYSKALSKGLYCDIKKQREISENIDAKADEIESYISQIITASKEDFLSFDIELCDFYLSELIKNITDYYSEKLALIKTDFNIGNTSDCLLKGDLNRSVEVLQNIIENAIKYGDGNYIGISFSREEHCVLIAVRNSGCTLSDSELLNIFDSFFRGQNTGSVQGSGLGLYICRQLMHHMNGEIFAEIDNGFMTVTAVFEMA